MPVLERILVCGVTGSGKTWAWLKMAEALKPTGALFRCLDTDNAVEYMLHTRFSHLLPENNGNVFVHDAFDWPEYRLGMKWALQQPLSKEEMSKLSTSQLKAYRIPVKPSDWVVIDMVDNAWNTVQRYFTTEVFQEEMGDYFLEARKIIRSRGDKDAKGKPVRSILPEALKGWVDWTVINRLYDDFILPLAYRSKCHVYATTKVERLDSSSSDPEVQTLFGDVGIRPAGQKRLGHQMHTVLLFIPGKDKWYVTTFKDRADRSYFKKTPLTSLYMQYLCAKAGWPIV